MPAARRKPAARKPSSAPSADVEASNQSTVADVNVSRGKARVRADDRSGVEGINVGKHGAKEAKGAKWWAEKLAFPVVVVVVGAILAWYLKTK